MTSNAPDGVESAVSRLDESLRLCLRARWDPEALPMARQLHDQAGLNWTAWCDLARDELLGPLLYHVLRRTHTVPGRVEEQLRHEYFANSARQVLALREVTRILEALATAGIPVIVLKGVALGLAVYQDITLRPMSDLDLLVRPGAVLDALEVLRRVGYAPVLSEIAPADILTFSNEVRLTADRPAQLSVEIHWSLFDSPLYLDKPPAVWLWQTARPLRVGDLETLMLGPEALLLHLCGHLAFHHGGQGLLWLHDIAEVLHHNRDRIDWQVILDQARASDLVLSVQQVLPRVAAGWHAPIPTDVLTTLSTLHASTAEARTLAWKQSDQPGVALDAWSVLTNLRGPRARLRYLAAKLFPSPTYMRHRYHVPHPLLVPLFYPYRWTLGLRSALKIARTAFQSQR